jgi:heptosyltransferase III
VNARRGKILVIRGGAIGDFILTLPAISALRQQFPQVHLEVLGYPHIIQLAMAGGLVDHARSIEARSLAGFFARNGELEAALADYFSEFDLIVSYLYDPDEIFKTNVGRCSPAQFLACAHRPDERSTIHAAKFFLKPLERLAIFEADPVPRLRLSLVTHSAAPGKGPAATEGVLSSPAKPVIRLALHPGSGSERKNWPEHNWAELLQKLINLTAFELLLVGGEAEEERLQRLAAALPLARARVAQSLPLTQLAGLLTRCQGFVGHDSGIAHLAAALGLPALLLWGVSNETIWRPPAERVSLVRDPGGLDRVSTETVFEGIQRLWPAEFSSPHK